MSAPTDPRRCVEVINAALHDAFERHDDVFLIGEDLLDPYGGAFNASRGLSTRWPDRVITTPISEASLVGIAAGMAIRGQRPIVEIMFGDFVTLTLDQVVNGVSKFREMYNDQVTVPLVVRIPMGGRRGYGPTHSQSLEKMLVGVPNIRVVATGECHDLRALVNAAIDDDEPVFLVENKVQYGRLQRRPVDGRIDGFAVRETAGPYPALTFSGNDFAAAEATIVTYGGMLPPVLDAVTAPDRGGGDLLRGGRHQQPPAARPGAGARVRGAHGGAGHRRGGHAHPGYRRGDRRPRAGGRLVGSARTGAPGRRRRRHHPVGTGPGGRSPAEHGRRARRRPGRRGARRPLTGARHGAGAPAPGIGDNPLL